MRTTAEGDRQRGRSVGSKLRRRSSTCRPTLPSRTQPVMEPYGSRRSASAPAASGVSPAFTDLPPGVATRYQSISFGRTAVKHRGYASGQRNRTDRRAARGRWSSGSTTNQTGALHLFQHSRPEPPGRGAGPCAAAGIASPLHFMGRRRSSDFGDPSPARVPHRRRRRTSSHPEAGKRAGPGACRDRRRPRARRT